MNELETRCGSGACSDIIELSGHHPVAIPLNHTDCHELKALAEVFGTHPDQLAAVILKAGLHDLHAGLDEDLAQMARELRAVMAEVGEVSLMHRA